ncbi:MAG: hypothetical protein HGA97_10540 [Chlorobiaceae bacterium]|nr:hypothetical protein [Chlorobiaceae bacterium]
MPRGPRLDTPGTLHHVMIRGIEKGMIFRDDIDRTEFLDRLGRLAGSLGTGIYAFVLMSNHVNLLLKSGSDGLPAFMRRLLSGYAQYFNRRHKRVGHLFQNRYKSIICDEKANFEKLVAYIHLNPLRAGLVPTFQQMALYPWSGHAALMNEVACDWMERDYVLRFFGKTEGLAKQAYRSFAEQEIGIDQEKELSGGGMVRSQGGWSKVLSMRKSGERVSGDDRILGSDDFVREILRDAQDRKDVQLPAIERYEIFNQEVMNICADAGVTEALLSSGSRMGYLPLMRKELARKAVIEHGVSIAEAARLLGVTTSAISHMLRRK